MKFINEILNLKDIIVKKTIHSDSYVKFFIETKPKTQICPCCGSETSRIHDYRMQTIKDLPFQFKDCFLVLRKRRYRCSCGKRFFENYSFLPRYKQLSSRLSLFIADSFHDSVSIKTIANKANVSTYTVSRILKQISFCRALFKDSISIDEFRGNASNEKFQCILADPIKHRVLDILPSRSQKYLVSYFKDIPRQERFRVKFFSCDMWQPYIDLAKYFFPNATVVIDRYHFVRQVTWAIENVRKRIQKQMPASLRKYFKRSRRLILSTYEHLSKEDKKACELMLLYNSDLSRGHFLKEYFFKICHNTKYSQQRQDFADWIKSAESSGLPEFEKCANTFRHWFKEILNSFKYSHISNGPTEGFNNKIKVLKRISYGVRNFENFRTRILMNMN